MKNLTLQQRIENLALAQSAGIFLSEEDPEKGYKELTKGNDCSIWAPFETYPEQEVIELIETHQNSFAQFAQSVLKLQDEVTPDNEMIERARDILKRAGYFFSIWSIEDILGAAEQRGIRLSKKAAKEIGEGIDRTHDATIGINWDVINSHIDMYREDKK